MKSFGYAQDDFGVSSFGNWPLPFWGDVTGICADNFEVRVWEMPE